MSRDPVYLLDILDAARLALAYVAGKTRDQFLADMQCQDAVIRRIEIIGSASDRRPMMIPSHGGRAPTARATVLGLLDPDGATSLAGSFGGHGIRIASGSPTGGGCGGR